MFGERNKIQFINVHVLVLRAMMVRIRAAVAFILSFVCGQILNSQ